jgi:quinol monooxygenase YgiN
VIKHIVLWKLKNPVDAARFKALLDTCKGLVPGMITFEVAVRTEALEANVDVALYSVFESKAALNAYQIHPEHKAVSAELGPLRDTRAVLDYEM